MIVTVLLESLIMITLKTSKLTTIKRTMLLMLGSRLRQVRILLSLFPIKILLKQCKRLFQWRHKETINIVQTCVKNRCCIKRKQQESWYLTSTLFKLKNCSSGYVHSYWRYEKKDESVFLLMRYISVTSNDMPGIDIFEHEGFIVLVKGVAISCM